MSSHNPRIFRGSVDVPGKGPFDFVRSVRDTRPRLRTTFTPPPVGPSSPPISPRPKPEPIKPIDPTLPVKPEAVGSMTINPLSIQPASTALEIQSQGKRAISTLVSGSLSRDSESIRARVLGDVNTLDRIQQLNGSGKLSNADKVSLLKFFKQQLGGV